LFLLKHRLYSRKFKLFSFKSYELEKRRSCSSDDGQSIITPLEDLIVIHLHNFACEEPDNPFLNIQHPLFFQTKLMGWYITYKGETLKLSCNVIVVLSDFESRTKWIVYIRSKTHMKKRRENKLSSVADFLYKKFQIYKNDTVAKHKSSVKPQADT
jgi:hypothetical protein